MCALDTLSLDEPEPTLEAPQPVGLWWLQLVTGVHHGAERSWCPLSRPSCSSTAEPRLWGPECRPGQRREPRCRFMQLVSLAEAPLQTGPTSQQGLRLQNEDTPVLVQNEGLLEQNPTLNP